MPEAVADAAGRSPARLAAAAILRVLGLALILLTGSAGVAAALPPTPTDPASASSTGPAAARAMYRLADARIDEASGIAVGIASPGVHYVENDGGDSNRFFAVDASTGATIATVTVPGAHNVDWEDIVVAPDAAGTSSVWLADIGDNGADRSEVQVYRVDEPRLRPSERGLSLHSAAADVWRLHYPSGPVDAESLAVAPNGTGYLVTKSMRGHSIVYRLPARPDPDRVQDLHRVATIDLRGLDRGLARVIPAAGSAATSAAISPDGRWFAVRTYLAAYLWPLDDGDVAAALREAPRRVALPIEPQGEGLGFTGDDSLVVDSEGRHSTVYSVATPALPTPSTGASEASTARSTPAPEQARDPRGASSDGDSDWHPIASLGSGLGGALLVFAGGAWLLRRRRRRNERRSRR